MRKTLAFIAVLSIFGCSSVPLSTMMQFRSFDEQDFLELDPTELRAKVRVNRGVVVSVPDSSLTLGIDNAKGQRLLEFPMQQLSTGVIPAKRGLFSAVPESTEYELALSETAVSSFTEFQENVRAGVPSGFTFSVGTSFSKLPDGLEEITMSVFLKLSADTEYVLLIDNAVVNMKPGAES